MTTKTRRELVDRALKVLGVLPAGATPSSEDVATVDDYVDDLFEELAERKIAYVADDDEIEVVLFRHLGVCLANACKEEFGVPAIDVTEAENELRNITAARPTYQPVKSEYF